MSATATPDTAYQAISINLAEGVLTITFNRPDVYNAINDAFTTELADALKQAARNPECRAIVLTGSGKAFCSGQDLGDLKSKYVPGHTPHLGDDLRRRYDPIIMRMTSMDKPIIAAVNGVAAGAGMSLALACDMRICSPHASFIEVFINVGLIPDSGSTWFLPRLVGMGRALELCMTGRKVDAEEAQRIGIANNVVPADQLVQEAQALAQRLAAMPARGLALMKKLLHQSFDHSLEEQLQAEAFAQDTAGRTHDHFEGVVAFIEKRKPAFRGK
ncbi:MAG: enoyl-CoA hydratase-related protein [Phycisphaerales bacterium]